MNTYIINSFNGGISDYENTGIEGSFKPSKNLDIHKDVNSISCKQALTDDMAAGTMSGLPIAIITASDGYTYTFADNGYIYRRASNGTYTEVYQDPDGAIKGAEEWYNNVGDTFLYWRTDTKLKRKRILDSSGAAVNTNWSDVNATVNGQTYPKTGLNSVTWGVLKQINGVLLGGNKNKLLQVGYDDSYTASALDLIPGNRVKSLLEVAKIAAIGCDRADNRQESGMFFWDGLSLAWNDKKMLASPSINAMISTDVDLAQVGSSGKVYYIDEINKKPIFSFPGGGQVNPYGVDVDDGLALFGVYGNGTGKSGVYSYGSKKNNANRVLNLEYQLDCDQIGAIKKVGTDLLISWKSGSSYGVKKVDTSNKATGTYVSLDLEAPADMAKEPIWQRVRLVTAPLPSGTSIEVWRKTNKSGNFTKANTADGSQAFSTTNGQEAVFFVGDAGKVAELQIVLNPSGNNSPEVYRVEVDFE